METFNGCVVSPLGMRVLFAVITGTGTVETIGVEIGGFSTAQIGEKLKKKLLYNKSRLTYFRIFYFNDFNCFGLRRELRISSYSRCRTNRYDGSRR